MGFVYPSLHGNLTLVTLVLPLFPLQNTVGEIRKLAGPFATDIDLEKPWGGPAGSFPSDRGVCRWALAQEPSASMDQTQIELHCWNAGGVEHSLDAAWIVEWWQRGPVVLELNLAPLTTVGR